MRGFGKLQEELGNLSKIENLSLSKEEISNKQLEVKSINDEIKFGDEVSKDLPNIRQAYAVQAMDEIRKSLYVKVQTLIRDEKVNQLYSQKQAIEETRITILEGVFGKGKLKNEQIRFIELQIKNLTQKPIEQKDKYSVRDSLAEMIAFTLLNSKTKEMEELETNIYEIFGGFTRDEVEQIARAKNSQRAELPIPVQEKMGLFKIRQNAKQLRKENNKREEEINENIVKANIQKGTQSMEEKQEAIAMFKNKLKTIYINTNM